MAHARGGCKQRADHPTHSWRSCGRGVWGRYRGFGRAGRSKDDQTRGLSKAAKRRLSEGREFLSRNFLARTAGGHCFRRSTSPRRATSPPKPPRWSEIQISSNRRGGAPTLSSRDYGNDKGVPDCTLFCLYVRRPGGWSPHMMAGAGERCHQTEIRVSTHSTISFVRACPRPNATLLLAAP